MNRMTPEEYQQQMKEIVAPLPKAFQSYVEAEAYDRGHSAGYEEVVSIARGMAYDLEVAVREYNRSLGLS